MNATTQGSPGPDNTENPPDSYQTLGGAGKAELKIQRSRFIAVATPTMDLVAAKACVAEQANQFHDSRHVCHAWRLGAPPPITENRNDDGEPSGTAGEPILAEIRKRQLTQVTVVVVRYFGGIKLGTGGLARAYGQAASEALAAAPPRVIKLGRSFELQFPYARQKTVQYLLSRHAGTIEKEVYGGEVMWRIWLPHSRWQAFASDLTQKTADTVHLRTAPAAESSS